MHDARLLVKEWDKAHQASFDYLSKEGSFNDGAVYLSTDFIVVS